MFFFRENNTTILNIPSRRRLSYTLRVFTLYIDFTIPLLFIIKKSCNYYTKLRWQTISQIIFLMAKIEFCGVQAKIKRNINWWLSSKKKKLVKMTQKLVTILKLNKPNRKWYIKAKATVIQANKKKKIEKK